MQPFPKKDDIPSIYLNPSKQDVVLGYNSISSNPVKGKEMLSRVLSDRISFLKKSIEEIKEQIQERHNLKNALNSEIDENLCETKTALYELDSLGTIADRLNSSRRSSLEGLLVALHKEKRRLELSHWQDTVMLERELRNMENELLSALRDLRMVRFLS